MPTEPRQSQSRSQTTRTESPRLRAPRRQAEAVTTAAPRYVTLGEGSRFEFVLATIAMAAIWVAFVAAILAL